jgi:hypothetical protein
MGSISVIDAGDELAVEDGAALGSSHSLRLGDGTVD